MFAAPQRSAEVTTEFVSDSAAWASWESAALSWFATDLAISPTARLSSPGPDEA